MQKIYMCRVAVTVVVHIAAAGSNLFELGSSMVACVSRLAFARATCAYNLRSSYLFACSIVL
jgi:hypothetical protein